MTFELWEDAYVLGLLFMALAILRKTIGALPWETVPMGRGGPTLSGLTKILPVIKQESASLEMMTCGPQASAVLMRIAAISRDPQQDKTI